MRESLALITFILLFWVGWKQSYQEHFADLMGEISPTDANRRAPAQTPVGTVNQVSTQTTEQRDNAWMWDRSKLDNPYDRRSSHGR